MKKEKVLREELERMRQLMGMNGSLYQKPIMGEGTPPSPKSPPGGKGGGKPPSGRPPSPSVPPASPPSPSPSPEAESSDTEDEAKKPKKGVTAASTGIDTYVMPFTVSGGPSKGGGGKRGVKKGRRKLKRGKRGVSKVNRSGKMKRARKRRGFEGNSMAGR